MSQQNQRTDGTEVELQHDARDFPEELPGNSIDPLGSGYLQPISEPSDGDSASAFSSQDMLLVASWAPIWPTLLAFLSLEDIFFLAY